MGLIRAGISALGGALADQWIDFFTVPPEVPHTATVFTAYSGELITEGGSNTKASDSIISNWLKTIVPEGYGLKCKQTVFPGLPICPNKTI